MCMCMCVHSHTHSLFPPPLTSLVIYSRLDPPQRGPFASAFFWEVAVLKVRPSSLYPWLLLFFSFLPLAGAPRGQQVSRAPTGQVAPSLETLTTGHFSLAESPKPGPKAPILSHRMLLAPIPSSYRTCLGVVGCPRQNVTWGREGHVLAAAAWLSITSPGLTLPSLPVQF